MDKQILGIHHVTAIAGDPQKNLDFYAGVLGLRLVKLTVNFDDPGTYHLYYGDGAGSPGTILTFFPWQSAPRGRRGTGQVTETAFAIPSEAIDYWAKRLAGLGVAVNGPVDRFGEQVLSISDPDGMGIELIATATAPLDRAWQAGPVPQEFAIRGFHSATLREERRIHTEKLLDIMGYRQVAQHGNRTRYAVDSGQSANLVDIVEPTGERHGMVAVGSVHHIAWRTPDDEQQRRWLTEIAREHSVSDVMDRKYFHSIYFREPGGILFEIATDNPGFAIDEPAETLGTHLVLPEWLEPDRARLEATLPKLRLPGVQAVGR